MKLIAGEDHVKLQTLIKYHTESKRVTEIASHKINDSNIEV